MDVKEQLLELQNEVKAIRKIMEQNQSFYEAVTDHLIALVQSGQCSLGRYDKEFWQAYFAKYARSKQP